MPTFLKVFFCGRRPVHTANQTVDGTKDNDGAERWSDCGLGIFATTVVLAAMKGRDRAETSQT